jgi:hypothetical protein
MQSNGRFPYGSPVKIGDKYQAGPLTVQNVMVEWNILDSSYQLIDKIQMKNGYLADVHDFQILPNGHYLLMSYEPNPIDMSKVYDGGDPNATVIGTVIQELDQNKNCVFQWRSTDFIPITDTRDDITKKNFEHVHGNSFFMDTDGNMIASFSTTNEIVKIDMVSGKMIWRLGGKNNQFKFNNEHAEYAPMYFSMQHDVKKLSNGNLLFYDNGLMKKTWFSRAVEYSIDEIKKEVSLIWEFRHTPDISAYAMGSVQRLSSGNTYINWGLIFKGLYRSVTEVNSNKETQFEMSLPSDAFSYRAFKYDLPACQPVANVDKYEILQGNTYSFKNATANTGVQIYFKQIDGFMYNLLNAKKYTCSPLNPVFEGESPEILPLRYVFTQNEIKTFGGEIRFEISSLPKLMNQNIMVVYYRPTEGSGTFIKLPTSIDANNKYIISQANDFGEYIIGLERNSLEIYPPSLLYPIDKKSFVNNSPVFINWSPTGRYDSFNLQVALDKNFENIVIDTIDLKDTRLILNFTANSNYYWRVRTSYKMNFSEWSTVREFSFSEPYVRLLNPKGGEVFTKDSNYVLRWDTNIPDSVKVTLIKEDADLSIITDSLYSYYNGLLWLVPTNIPDGNFYKIKVQSIKNELLTAESETNFTIKSFVGVDDYEDMNLSINHYPNPSNGSIVFDFNVNQTGLTSIILYDIFGNTISQIYSDYITPGNYKIKWDTGNLLPGIYFYRISVGTSSELNKIVIIK